MSILRSALIALIATSGAVTLTLAAPVTGAQPAAAAECTGSSTGPGIPPPAGIPSGIPGFHASWYGQSGYMRLCPGESATATVQERATSYVVTSHNERTIGASRLVRAALTLAKSNLHPIEQTLVVQRGEELREYKFVETLFELLPANDVAPNVFEIDRE